MKYKVTTRSEDYEEWQWYKDYKQLKALNPSESTEPQGGHLLPIEYGVQYCRWILETPEVRDIFCLSLDPERPEDPVETGLLMSSKSYFLMKVGIHSRLGARLSVCWPVVQKILQGELPSDNNAIRTELSRFKTIFDVSGDLPPNEGGNHLQSQHQTHPLQ